MIAKYDGAKCDKCPYKEGTTVASQGPDKADIVFVGDLPNIYETFENKPFAGQAGQLVTKCLQYMGLDINDCFRTMACLCSAPTGHKLKQLELDCCRDRLIREIKSREPKLVVIMGNTAVQSITRMKPAISTLRGQSIYLQDLGCQVLYTFHPAAVIKAAKNFSDFSADLAKIPELLTPKTSVDILLDTNVKVYSDINEAINMLDFMISKEYVACDIETTGFNFRLDTIMCLALVATPGEGHVLDRFMLRHPLIRYKLRKLFESKTKLIWQNGKFDIKFIRTQWKIQARVDEDTMLKHYCVDERKGTHDLETLSTRYLGTSGYKSAFREKQKFEDGLKFNAQQLMNLYVYCAQDTDYTFRINPILDKLLDVEGNARRTYEYILIRASESFARIEMTGLYADLEYLEEIRVRYENNLEILYNRMHAIVDLVGWDPQEYANKVGAKKVPIGFNLKSPKQLAFVIFDLMKLPLFKKSRTTDKKAIVHWRFKVLKEPAEKGFDGDDDAYNKAIDAWRAENPVHDFIYSLTTYRKDTKIYDTYIMGVKRSVDEDGRVHPTFKLHGTETGRLACSEPNVQNIPRGPLIKNIFVAKPGYILIQADFSQAELRCLAVMSNDPFLRNTYLNGGDLHDDVALELFGPGYTKEHRTRAKAVNFGLAYGRTEYTIAEEYNMKVADAREVIRLWFLKIPTAGQYIKDRRGDPKRQGETVETHFGRKRRYPLITEDNAWNIENEAINFPISSTSSDCTLLSVIEMEDPIAEYGAYIINEVHDSIVAEVPIENAYPVAKLMKTIMEIVPSRELNTDVPFVADIEIGFKYGAVKKVENLEDLRLKYGEGYKLNEKTIAIGEDTIHSHMS